jgi:hypothetical protein
MAIEPICRLPRCDVRGIMMSIDVMYSFETMVFHREFPHNSNHFPYATHGAGI